MLNNCAKDGKVSCFSFYFTCSTCIFWFYKVTKIEFKKSQRLNLHEIRVNQQKFQGINDSSIFYSIGTRFIGTLKLLWNKFQHLYPIKYTLVKQHRWDTDYKACKSSMFTNDQKSDTEFWHCLLSICLWLNDINSRFKSYLVHKLKERFYKWRVTDPNCARKEIVDKAIS